MTREEQDRWQVECHRYTKYKADSDGYCKAVTQPPAPHLKESTLVNYVIELENDIINLKNTNQIYKDLIDENNTEIARKTDQIVRLKGLREFKF